MKSNLDKYIQDAEEKLKSLKSYHIEYVKTMLLLEDLRRMKQEEIEENKQNMP